MEPAIRATRTAAIKTVAVATRVTMFERRACAMAGCSATYASAFTGLAHLVLERRRQFMDPSGKPEFDAAACQLINLPTNGLGEQAHQGVDLVFGTRPVFCGKGIEGEHPDATLVGRLGDTTDGLDPCLVTHDARQQPFTGPAAVAIHDDRDVLGRGQLAHWWFV